MKIVFYIIIFVIALLFTANTQITFKPFSISFDDTVLKQQEI